MKVQEIDQRKIELIKVGRNFLGILNDIKRRPEDAANELKLPLEKINSIISGDSELTDDIVNIAVKIWPVNRRDFYTVEDDCPQGVKIMTASESEKSSRIMNRADKPYYEYRDTAMSKISPFRPEWIEELCRVKDNDPQNDKVQWNNGHFMHQFTYFIGKVNFYYKDENGIKQTAVMNSGDSMYITPFVPHTFTTRDDAKENGLILALTYGGKLTGDPQHELSALSGLGSEFALDFSSKEKTFSSLLKFHRDNGNLSLNEISERTGIEIQKLKDFENGIGTPTINELGKIAESLTINIRDLLPNDKNEKKVIVKHHDECKTWFYPEDTKCYKMYELAASTTLPFSKSFEIEILNENNPELDLVSGTHQYAYNIGGNSISFNWKLGNNQNNAEFHPGDSLYIKPFVTHSFRGNGKILVLRIGGKTSGDAQRELSIVGRENAERAISETTQWFDPRGKK